MKKLSTHLAAGAVALIATAASATAAETVLRLSNWLPPSHPIVRDMVMPWAENVEAATEGRVEVQILDAPLGPPPAHFDLTATGATDLAFGVHGYTPGRFALTDLGELPFMTPTSEALSVAYWRLHEAMLAEKNEHAGVHVLGVFGHGPGHLFTTGTKVTPLGELAGAKIRVPGATTSMLADQMGMVPLQAPSPKTYELLSNGVADGIYFPYESVPFFKLDSLITEGFTVPGGLYNTSFFFAMNQARWDGLSDEDKAAIDSVSGEAFARLAGQAWDAADAAALDSLKETVNFHAATGEELDALKEMTAPIFEAVREKVTAKGVDFDAAVALLEAETAKAAAQ